MTTPSTYLNRIIGILNQAQLQHIRSMTGHILVQSVAGKKTSLEFLNPCVGIADPRSKKHRHEPNDQVANLEEL